MDALSLFLRRESRRAFNMVTANCLLLPADWLVALGLADPAGPWRGTFFDEAGALALLAEHGGPVGLMGAALVKSPVRPVAHAVRGDVGVVTVLGPSGSAQVGAVCTGARWACRSRDRGVWIGRAEALAAWRVEGA